jgi:hypothetical protein
MTAQESKTLRFFKFYSIFLTVAITVLVILSFKSGKTHFEEIDVERINVVEKNGDLKMVISNHERQHPGAMNGKDFPKRSREAGIIFFNSQGDECGGLVYDGNAKEAGMVYSIDKYKDDQIMQLQYMENTQDKSRKYGLQLWEYGKEDAIAERYDRFEKIGQLKNDSLSRIEFERMRKEGLMANERLFVGKTFNNEVGLFIKDKNGIPRIKVYVNKQNEPRIEFLDTAGNLIPVR